MSESRQKATARRDARNAKDEIKPAATAAKKDTKRWCGGYVGREHVGVCVAYGVPGGIFDRWRVLQCTTCGRKLDHYYPLGQSFVDRPKPDWVTN
jgi:hypothetical protein